MIPAAQKEFEILEQRFRDGDRLALVRGLKIAVVHRVMPGWIADALKTAVDDIERFRARSWDDVLPPVLPDRAHLAARRRRLELAPKIYQSVTEKIENGAIVDQSLFEDVAQLFKISRSLCSEFYYSHRERISTKS